MSPSPSVQVAAGAAAVFTAGTEDFGGLINCPSPSRHVPLLVGAPSSSCVEATGALDSRLEASGGRVCLCGVPRLAAGSGCGVG